MIIIVEGQAQIHYSSNWSVICDELEAIYPIENYTSINAYGTVWAIKSMEDVLSATNILRTWGDL